MGDGWILCRGLAFSGAFWLVIVSHYGFEQPRIEKKKLAHLLIHLVPCAIDKTEMVAAFPGEVLEVIQISSVFNAEKNVLTSIFFNFWNYTE